MTTEEILKARKFLVDGELTNATILLFSNNPTKYLPQARLRILKYNSNYQKVGEQINVVKDVTFDESIHNIIVKSKQFIQTILRDFQYLDKNGMFKIMPEYPEFAWVESIVNALTHRNYSIRRGIHKSKYL